MVRSKEVWSEIGIETDKRFHLVLIFFYFRSRLWEVQTKILYKLQDKLL